MTLAIHKPAWEAHRWALQDRVARFSANIHGSSSLAKANEATK